MEATYTIKIEEHPDLIRDIRTKYIGDNIDLRNVTFSPGIPLIFYDYKDKTRVFIEKAGGVYKFEFDGENKDISEAKLELEKRVNIKLKLEPN